MIVVLPPLLLGTWICLLYTSDAADDLDAAARLAQANCPWRLPALHIVVQGITFAGIVLVTFDGTGLLLMIVVLPPLLLGTWIGWQLYGRLNERRFRQGLALLLIASGATLIF